MKAVVHVFLKPGVLDVQGKASSRPCTALAGAASSMSASAAPSSST